MPKIGYVGQRKSDGKWFARVQVNGQDKTKWAKTEDEARTLLDKLIAEYASGAITAPPAVLNPAAHTEASPITFKTVADQYSAHKVRPAQYRNDHKIAGLRSERTARLRIAVLVEYFGEMPIDRITPATIERFKLERLNTRTRNKTERQIASVNRELEQLRAILRYARNEGLITASPFERSSSPLISKADETKRTRVLSREEEI